MANKIELTKSVNAVPFGADRDAVISAFGQPLRSFNKSPMSKAKTDAFEGFNVYYTSEYKLEAVEFTKGVELIVNGHSVPWDYSALKAWMLTMDPNAQVESDGITSAVSGIGMFAVGNDVQSLLFAASDYYA